MGYQARERQKVTRRRMGVRNRSAMLYLALAKEISFCRSSLSSLGQRKGRGAIREQLAGRRKTGSCRPGASRGACLECQMGGRLVGKGHRGEEGTAQELSPVSCPDYTSSRPTSRLSFSPSSFLPLKAATHRRIFRAFKDFPDRTIQRMDSGIHLWAKIKSHGHPVPEDL